VNRTRAWLIVAPVLAAGVLVAHTLAYRVTGTPADAFHSYLQHVPQILLIAALLGLGLGGAGRRLDAPRLAFFAAVALTTFVVQEHVERLVHDGTVPMLLTTPAFLVGVLLQLPVAVIAWALARYLLAAIRENAVPRPRTQRLVVLLLAPATDGGWSRGELRLPPGRGPPPLLSTD
jgi:hypothetical protein